MRQYQYQSPRTPPLRNARPLTPHHHLNTLRPALAHARFSCSTAIALRGKDGVVFAIEYNVTSKLLEKEPHHRIFNIAKHIVRSPPPSLHDTASTPDWHYLGASFRNV